LGGSESFGVEKGLVDTQFTAFCTITKGKFSFLEAIVLVHYGDLDVFENTDHLFHTTPTNITSHHPSARAAI
jgi:hypothetical protein